MHYKMSLQFKFWRQHSTKNKLEDLKPKKKREKHEIYIYLVAAITLTKLNNGNFTSFFLTLPPLYASWNSEFFTFMLMHTSKYSRSSPIKRGKTVDEIRYPILMLDCSYSSITIRTSFFLPYLSSSTFESSSRKTTGPI